jgi:hypothetical protein
MLLFLIGALAGCAPSHFSVAVAYGPNHVTFAQCHRNADQDDYLLDCPVSPGGIIYECDAIALPGAR